MGAPAAGQGFPNWSWIMACREALPRSVRGSWPATQSRSVNPYVARTFTARTCRPVAGNLAGNSGGGDSVLGFRPKEWKCICVSRSAMQIIKYKLPHGLSLSHSLHAINRDCPSHTHCLETEPAVD